MIFIPKLYVVGIGPGDFAGMTLKAILTLNSSDMILGKKQYGPFVSSYFPRIKFVSDESGTREMCLLAIREAARGQVVSVIGQGDTGIYGMAGIVFELVEEEKLNLEVEIVPGVTAAIAGAAVLGAPLMQDFAIITLSDNLAESANMLQRIECAARADFTLVFYNPCNPTRGHLRLAKDLLLKLKPGHTPIGIVKNIGRDNQEFFLSTLQEMSLEIIDKFSVVYIGNSNTCIKIDKIVTPL